MFNLDFHSRQALHPRPPPLASGCKTGPDSERLGRQTQGKEPRGRHHGLQSPQPDTCPVSQGWRGADGSRQPNHEERVHPGGGHPDNRGQTAPPRVVPVGAKTSDAQTQLSRCSHSVTTATTQTKRLEEGERRTCKMLCPRTEDLEPTAPVGPPPNYPAAGNSLMTSC